MAVLINYIQKEYPWLTVGFVLSSIFYALLIAVIIKSTWSKRKMYLLSLKLPGPFAIPFLGCVSIMKKLRPLEHAYDVLCKEFKKYSSPFRLWLGTKFFVVVSDPEDISDLFEHFLPLKPIWYSFLSNSFGNGLLTGRGGELWQKHRCLLNPSFDILTIDSYQNTLNMNSEKLINMIKPTEIVNLKDIKIYFERFYSNIIFESLFDSKEIDFQDGNTDHILNAVNRIHENIRKKIVYSFLCPKHLCKKNQNDELMIKFRSEIQNCINEAYRKQWNDYWKKKKTGKEPKIATNPVSILVHSHDEHGLSEQEVVEEMMNIYISGFNSTCNILGFFIFMMSTYKDCQQKLFQEINNFHKTHKTSDINLEVLDELKYLDRCLKEVLRLYPSEPFIFREIGKDIILFTKKISIPKETIVIVPSYNNRIDDKYWENPKTFNPDRFDVSEDMEENALINKFTCMPFSAPPRECIGRNLATQLIKTAIIHLLNKFEFNSDVKLSDTHLTYYFTTNLLWDSKISIRVRQNY